MRILPLNISNHWTYSSLQINQNNKAFASSELTIFDSSKVK